MYTVLSMKEILWTSGLKASVFLNTMIHLSSRLTGNTKISHCI